jgi:hypothetical protein
MNGTECVLKKRVNGVFPIRLMTVLSLKRERERERESIKK